MNGSLYLRRLVPLLAIWVSSIAHAITARPAGPYESDPPPSFVVILVDDLGWSDLACQGNAFHETPNIDRLASQGVRFTNAYAAGSVSSPSRAALLTGRNPARIGITDAIRGATQGGSRTPNENSELDGYFGGPRSLLSCPPNPWQMEHDELTIAEALRDHGYRTALVGKWNLGDQAWFPTTQGFDENYGGCDYDHPPSYFDPFSNKRTPGFPSLPSRKVGEHLTKREADEAVAFIRRQKDAPFFLLLAHHAVHSPLQAEKARVDRFKEKKSHVEKETAESSTDSISTSQINPKYAAMIEGVDDAVGAVMDELDAQGIRDRTWVFLTSDNGGRIGPISNAPLRGSKGQPYEGGIRIPFIAGAPAVSRDTFKGLTASAPISGIDLFPTILDLAKVALPEDRNIDGKSFAQTLRSEESRLATPRDLVWHYPHYRGKIAPYSVLRRGSWKLLFRHEGPTHELYDLSTDIGEARDLAAAHPDVVVELSVALNHRLDDLGAKRPRPNPQHGTPTYSREIHPDNRDRPRVLLLGDSISMGYTPIVREDLHGTAAVFRPMWPGGGSENCEGTQKGVKTLEHWLIAEGGQWDVIHFNFGLHDLKRVDPVTRENSKDPSHPYQSDPDAYERQLRTIVRRLRETGASLIFATTTPVPEGVRPYRDVTDPLIYNEIATRVMADHGVPINDLFAFAEPRLGEIQGSKDVHFTKDGSRALAREVARHIRRALDGR